MDKSFSSSGNDKITQYVLDSFRPEDAVLEEVRQRSQKAGLPSIQVGGMDGLHIETIARAMGAKKTVEIGTLGGYSGIHLLRGMGPAGKLWTFELEPRNAEVARESFKKAGVDGQAEILVGQAMENLPKIAKHGPFDLVFIDADKESYPKYLDWAAENLRVGGAVLGDNTFAFGMIADEKFEDPDDEKTVWALRRFNDQAASGGRFRGTMIPTGEGLTFAVKIG